MEKIRNKIVSNKKSHQDLNWKRLIMGEFNKNVQNIGFTQSSMICSKSYGKFNFSFTDANSRSKYSRNDDKFNKWNVFSSGKVILFSFFFPPNLTYFGNKIKIKTKISSHSPWENQMVKWMHAYFTEEGEIRYPTLWDQHLTHKDNGESRRCKSGWLLCNRMNTIILCSPSTGTC